MVNIRQMDFRRDALPILRVYVERLVRQNGQTSPVVDAQKAARYLKSQLNKTKIQNNTTFESLHAWVSGRLDELKSKEKFRIRVTNSIKSPSRVTRPKRAGPMADFGQKGSPGAKSGKIGSGRIPRRRGLL